MAARQWDFRNVDTRSRILAVFMIINFCFQGLLTQTTDVTTNSTDNTTIPAVTTSTQATTTTATTVQVQTTPAATSAPQTAFPSNTDLGPCPCDLTGSGCDVNCCCDEDCSDNDRLAFSSCLANSYLSKTDDRVCFQQNIVVIFNTPFENNVTSDNLLCIYKDNYAQRNFYNIPDIITSEDSDRLDTYIKRYAGPSFQTQQRTNPRSFPQTYLSGGQIYTLYENLAVGILGLPVSLHSSVCVDNNPAAYLYKQSATCQRPLGNLSQTCETSLAIKASTYYVGFKVVKNPGLLRNYGNLTNASSGSFGNTSQPSSGVCDLSTVDNLYNNSCVTEVLPQSPHLCFASPGGISQYCNFTDIPVPQYNSDRHECNNVVSQVQYIITTNGTSGIVSVEVKFVFTTLTQSDLPLTQTFKTEYQGLNGADPQYRSGNPGYVVGQPVLEGKVVSQTDIAGLVSLAVQQNSTLPEENALTILKPSMSGDCTLGTQGRSNVLFGEDMRTGCYISFNMSDMGSNCQRMQLVALSALWPYNDGSDGPGPPRNWSVATFGNSDPHTVGDWVNILVQNTPRGAVAGTGAECVDMVLGAHIQILYSNVGSLSNPQPKILGVSFIYESPQTIAFQCSGAYCQPGAEGLTQRFEVVQSVSFIDVSQPAAEFYSEPPLFLAKVPYDFFYPFALGSATSLTNVSLVTMIGVIVSRIILGIVS